MPPPQAPIPPGFGWATAGDALRVDGEAAGSSASVVVAATAATAFLCLLLLLAALVCRHRRRRRREKEACEATTVDIKIDLVSAKNDDIAGDLAEAIAPQTAQRVDVPAALQRIRSLRMRSAAPGTAGSRFAPSSPGDDDPENNVDVEAELGMEFDILRQNMQRRVSKVENLPRLERRHLQVQKVDALLLAWQNRERSVLSVKLLHDLPATHELRSFDPESFANRAMVTQQARILTREARRRASARLHGGGAVMGGAAGDADLDPITGVIRRASLAGGRLNACDLASQCCSVYEFCVSCCMGDLPSISLGHSTECVFT